MIEKIHRHYSMTNPASIYDEEALTSLELSALAARKVNEVIDAQNELADEVDRVVMEVADTLNGVEERVAQEVSEHIENGDLESAFREHFDGLSHRLDEAISGVTEGAEILDARVTHDGRKFPTVGAMARTEFERISGQLEDIANYKTELVPRENMEKICGTLYTTVWEDGEGVHVDTTVAGPSDSSWSAGYNMGMVRIRVNPGEVYLVSAYYGWNTPIAAVFRNNPNEQAALHTYGYNLPDKMVKEKFTTPIVIPENDEVYYLYVCWTNENMHYEECCENIVIKKVVGAEIKNVGLEEYVSNLLKPTLSFNPIYAPVVDLGDCEFGVLQLKDNGQVKITATDTLEPKYNVWYNPLNPGEHIRFKGEANFNNIIYAFVDGNGCVTDYKQAAAGSAMNTEEVDIIVPMGVAGVYVAGYYDGAGVAEKVVGYTESDKKWSHLKWACLGDSITEHNTRSTKNYDQYINEKTGIKVQNLGVSGAGYKAEFDVGTAMVDLAGNIEEDTDVVTIMAGVNDIQWAVSDMGVVGDSSGDAILSLVWDAYAEARDAAPNAKIAIIAPLSTRTFTPKDDNNLTKIVNKLEEFCRYHGIPFLDLYRLAHGTLRPDDGKSKSKYYSGETGLNLVHPDANGHKVISSFIYKFLDELIGTY